MSHVFVSYAREDKHYVHNLCAQIRDRGFTPWIDEDIEYGERWFKIISKAIEECAALIVVMTPEAEESEWVEKEILMAMEKYKKPIFPLLLRGEVFDLLISKQFIKLDKKNDYLPPVSFYRNLAKSVPRREKFTQEERLAEERRRGIVKQPTELDPTIYEEIKKWERFAEDGETDFYGIAMLALALEAEGSYRSHKLAMHHLRRACMIEPNVRNKKFMTDHYNCTEEQHKLFERILADPRFFV